MFLPRIPEANTSATRHASLETSGACGSQQAQEHQPAGATRTAAGTSPEGLPPNHRVLRDVDFKSKSPLEIDVMNRVFSDTVDLNRARTDMPAFGAGRMQVIDTGKAPVLAFARENEQQKVVLLANFSPSPQKVDPEHLRTHGMADTVIDKIGPQEEQEQKIGAGVELAPYQCMWLVPAGRGQPQLGTAEAGTPATKTP